MDLWLGNPLFLSSDPHKFPLFLILVLAYGVSARDVPQMPVLSVLTLVVAVQQHRNSHDEI